MLSKHTGEGSRATDRDPALTAGRATVLAGAAAIMFAASVPGWSQTTAAAGDAPVGEPLGAIEEIVVTATKRGDLGLQDVPFAVQALNSEALSALGAADFNDFFRFVPGLAVLDQGPGDKRYILRGVNSTGAGTVGLYLDEIIITGENAQDGGGRQPDVKLFDIERVEVLKGPQGTTFGSSSMSGTLRYITKKPVMGEVSARVFAALQQTDEADLGGRLEGVVNLPLAGERAALRLAGYYLEEEGYIDNLVEDAANSESTGAARAILRLLPTDSLTVDLTLMYQDMETDGPAYYNRVNYFGDPISRGEDDLRQADVARAPFLDEMIAWNATALYALDHGTITGAASFFDRETEFNRDSSFAVEVFTGGALPLLGAGRSVITQPKDRELDTFELRYASEWDSPVQILAGGFFQSETREFRSAILTTDDSGVIESEPTAILDRFVRTDIDELAFFGEVSWDIGERLTLIGGLRYFDFEIDEQARVDTGFGGGPGSGLGPALNATEDGVIFKGNIAYRVTPDNQIYFRVAEGFRSGGTNDTTAAEIADVTIPAQFDSDDLINYELGSKNGFRDGRVTANAAVYFIDWSEIQIQDQATDGQLTFPFRGNGGGADIWGIELDAQFRPLDGLDLGVALSYTEAELSEDNPVPSSGLDGDAVPYVPEWTASLRADYSWPLERWSARAGVGGDLSYIDERNTEFRPDNPLFVKLDSYALLNLRASLEWERWKAGLIVQNATDDDTVVDVFRIVPGLTPTGFIENWPRTFLLTLERTF